MRANPSASVFLVELDAMIARVQAALTRLRVAEADPVLTARRANRIELNRRKLDQALTRLGIARMNQLARDRAGDPRRPPLSRGSKQADGGERTV
jgi:hypothetical protein